MNRTQTLTISMLAASFVAGCADNRAAKVAGEATETIIAAPIVLTLLPLAFAIEPFERTRETKGPPPGSERDGYVTLDEGYRAAFGVSASSDAVDQKTGQVLHSAFTRSRDMRSASDLVFKLAVQHGLRRDDTIICSEPLHQGEKTYLLLSVVSRHPPKGTQVSAMPFDSWHTPNPATDKVLDWVAIDAALIDQDKYYAYLLAAAAQAMFRPPSDEQPDYWSASRLWREGRLAEVLEMSNRRGELVAHPAQAGPTAP
jgi:hypothetical protein